MKRKARKGRREKLKLDGGVNLVFFFKDYYNCALD
jgi:hypothetical protein